MKNEKVFFCCKNDIDIENIRFFILDRTLSYRFLCQSYKHMHRYVCIKVSSCKCTYLSVKNAAGEKRHNNKARIFTESYRWRTCIHSYCMPCKKRILSD